MDVTLYVGDTNTNSFNQRLTGITHWCVEAGAKGRTLFPDGAKVLNDSGAFPDVKRGRITFPQALDRQLAVEERSGWISETLVSYDLLIDEVLDPNGVQRKERWAEKEGWHAVEVTVAAAQFLAARRAHLAPRTLCLSCQGVSPDQYEACAKQVLVVAEPGDIFGFGGWCILGQQTWREPEFAETLRRVVPLIAQRGLQRAHLFGVAWTPAVRAFARLCRSYGIQPSIDTTRFYCELVGGYQFNPASGSSRKVANGNICTKDNAERNIRAAWNYYGRILTNGPPELDLGEVA